jgi:hypothetical protein
MRAITIRLSVISENSLTDSIITPLEQSPIGRNLDNGTITHLNVTTLPIEDSNRVGKLRRGLDKLQHSTLRQLSAILQANVLVKLDGVRVVHAHIIAD